jgi:hypothetical protein
MHPDSSASAPPLTPEQTCIADTCAWVERAVVGLNLCPFARAPHVRGQIHYAVSDAPGWQGLLDDLAAQAQALLALPAPQRETTLLIVPTQLQDFIEFNGFLGAAQSTLARAGFEGRLQLASFHPDYQFAGSDPQDMANYSNRSPWPTLHLLREDSIGRAVLAMERPDAIYEANIENLQRLGPAGWDALKIGRT